MGKKAKPIQWCIIDLVTSEGNCCFWCIPESASLNHTSKWLWKNHLSINFCPSLKRIEDSQVALVENLPVSAGGAGLIPGSERSPGVGNGNSLKYSYLEFPVDRKPGRLQSIVLPNWTRLSNWARAHTHTHTQGKCQVKMKTEITVMHLQAKECQRWPANR